MNNFTLLKRSYGNLNRIDQNITYFVRIGTHLPDPASRTVQPGLAVVAAYMSSASIPRAQMK